MNSSKNKLQEILFISILVFATLGMFRGESSPKLTPDSDSYIHFAEDLLSGRLFQNFKVETIPLYSAIRTPGYPIILAASKIIFPPDFGGILIFHLFFAIIALLAVMSAMKRYCPIYLSGPLILLSFNEVKSFFPLVQTEWVAFCLILIVFSRVVKYLSYTSISNFFLLSIFIGIAILVRPALIVLIVIPIILPIIRPVLQFWTVISTIVVGIMPVLLWMSFNFYRLGEFKLAAFEGFNIFGVGTMIGAPAPEGQDTLLMKQFISDVNSNKIPTAGTEKQFLNKSVTSYDQKFYNHNIYNIALSLPDIKKMDPVRINSMMRMYGLRSIADNPDVYALYIWQGLRFLQSQRWILLVGLLLAIALRRHEELTGLAFTVGIAMGIHLGHSVMCAMIQIVILRYHLLTAVPFNLFVVLLCASLVSKNLKWR